MRKIAILFVVLGVSLALASSERWIGPTPVHQYTIPNPEPGVFSPAPPEFRPAVDTFKYDDNMPGSAWAWNQAGSGWGAKFISPSDNVTLAGALIHFYANWPVPGGTRAVAKVFADDGANGSPGTELWHSDTLTITRGQWNWIPVGQPVVGSNFYIFYMQTDSYPMCPGLSIDAFNNAPSHRMWSYTGTDGFSEDSRRGEWLIRAVVDWTPQEHNATALYFASNMPGDTIPGINLTIRAMIQNLGTADLAAGTPVRLHITGPQSYTYDDTMNTSANLPRGQRQQMNFSPAWRVPSTSGAYRIWVWVEGAGEQWPADDTICYDLSIAKWIEYANYANPHWVTWQQTERATKFNPTDFQVAYPVGLSRVRTQFYLHPQAPWPDSSYVIKIYAEDGQTVLYETDTLEAPPGSPGPIAAADLDSMLLFASGEFYVSVKPIHSSGHPSTLADDTTNQRSFYRAGTSWVNWTLGEFFISASVQGGVGVAEGYRPVNEPTLRVVSYPNPVAEFVTIGWQVPKSQGVELSLYDATGRAVRSLYRGQDKLFGSLRLDARGLPAGIYLVRLESESGSVTRKLVLEH